MSYLQAGRARGWGRPAGTIILLWLGALQPLAPAGAETLRIWSHQGQEEENQAMRDRNAGRNQVKAARRKSA